MTNVVRSGSRMPPFLFPPLGTNREEWFRTSAADHYAVPTLVEASRCTHKDISDICDRLAMYAMSVSQEENFNPLFSAIEYMNDASEEYGGPTGGGRLGRDACDAVLKTLSQGANRLKLEMAALGQKFTIGKLALAEETRLRAEGKDSLRRFVYLITRLLQVAVTRYEAVRNLQIREAKGRRLAQDKAKRTGAVSAMPQKKKDKADASTKWDCLTFISQSLTALSTLFAPATASLWTRLQTPEPAIGEYALDTLYALFSSSLEFHKQINATLKRNFVEAVRATTVLFRLTDHLSHQIGSLIISDRYDYSTVADVITQIVATSENLTTKERRDGSEQKYGGRKGSRKGKKTKGRGRRVPEDDEEEEEEEEVGEEGEGGDESKAAIRYASDSASLLRKVFAQSFIVPDKTTPQNVEGLFSSLSQNLPRHCLILFPTLRRLLGHKHYKIRIAVLCVMFNLLCDQRCDIPLPSESMGLMWENAEEDDEDEDEELEEEEEEEKEEEGKEGMKDEEDKVVEKEKRQAKKEARRKEKELERQKRLELGQSSPQVMNRTELLPLIILRTRDIHVHVKARALDYMSHLLESAATDDSVLQSLLSEKYPEIIDALMRKIRDKAVKSNFIKNELNKYQNDMDAVEEEIENTKRTVERQRRISAAASLAPTPMEDAPSSSSSSSSSPTPTSTPSRSQSAKRRRLSERLSLDPRQTPSQPSQPSQSSLSDGASSSQTADDKLTRAKEYLNKLLKDREAIDTSLRLIRSADRYQSSISSALKGCAELLSSTAVSDVTATIDLYATAKRKGIDDADLYMRQLLPLVWSSHPHILTKVVNAYRSAYLFDPQDDHIASMPETSRAHLLLLYAHSLASLLHRASPAELACFERLLPGMLFRQDAPASLSGLAHPLYKTILDALFRIATDDDVVYQKRRPHPNASRTLEKTDSQKSTEKKKSGPEGEDAKGKKTPSQGKHSMTDEEGDEVEDDIEDMYKEDAYGDVLLFDKDDFVGLDRRTHKLISPEVRASALTALSLLIAPAQAAPLPPPTVVTIEEEGEEEEKAVPEEASASGAKKGKGKKKGGKKGSMDDDDDSEDDDEEESSSTPKPSPQQQQQQQQQQQASLQQHDPRKHFQLLLEYTNRLLSKLPRLRVARMHPTFAAAVCDFVAKRYTHVPSIPLHDYLISRCLDYFHGLVRFLWRWVPVPRIGYRIEWSGNDSKRALIRTMSQSKSSSSKLPTTTSSSSSSSNTGSNDVRPELIPHLVKKGLPAYRDLFPIDSTSPGPSSSSQPLAPSSTPSSLSASLPSSQSSLLSPLPSSSSSPSFALKTVTDLKQALLLQTVKTSKYYSAAELALRALCLISPKPEVDLETLLNQLIADTFSPENSQHQLDLIMARDAPHSTPSSSSSSSSSTVPFTDLRSPSAWCPDSSFSCCVDEADDALVCIGAFPSVTDDSGRSPQCETLSGQEMLARLLFVAGHAVTELNVLVDGAEVRDRTLANELIAKSFTKEGQGEEQAKKKMKLTKAKKTEEKEDDGEDDDAVSSGKGKGAKGKKASAKQGSKAVSGRRGRGKKQESEDEEEEAEDDADEEDDEAKGDSEEEEEEEDEEDEELVKGRKRKAPSRGGSKAKADSKVKESKGKGVIRKKPDTDDTSTTANSSSGSGSSGDKEEDEQTVQDRQQLQAELDHERQLRLERVRASLVRSGSMMLTLLSVIDGIVKGSAKVCPSTHKIIEYTTKDKTVRSIEILPSSYSHTLLSSAGLALSRIMSVSSTACDIGMPLLLSLLSRKNSPILQCHAIVGLCDIAFRFTSVFEQHAEQLYACLRSGYERVRRHALLAICYTTAKGMLKPKGPFPHLGMLVADEDDRCAELARAFFQQLHEKEKNAKSPLLIEYPALLRRIGQDYVEMRESILSALKESITTLKKKYADPNYDPPITITKHTSSNSNTSSDTDGSTSSTPLTSPSGSDISIKSEVDEGMQKAQVRRAKYEEEERRLMRRKQESEAKLESDHDKIVRHLVGYIKPSFTKDLVDRLFRTLEVHEEAESDTSSSTSLSPSPSPSPLSSPLDSVMTDSVSAIPDGSNDNASTSSSSSGVSVGGSGSRSSRAYWYRVRLTFRTLELLNYSQSDAFARLVSHLTSVQEPFRDYYNVVKVETIMDSFIDANKGKTEDNIKLLVLRAEEVKEKVKKVHDTLLLDSKHGEDVSVQRMREESKRLYSGTAATEELKARIAGAASAAVGGKGAKGKGRGAKGKKAEQEGEEAESAEVDPSKGKKPAEKKKGSAGTTTTAKKAPTSTPAKRGRGGRKKVESDEEEEEESAQSEDDRKSEDEAPVTKKGKAAPVQPGTSGRSKRAGRSRKVIVDDDDEEIEEL